MKIEWEEKGKKYTIIARPIQKHKPLVEAITLSF